jgi:hypothetical protein
VAEYSPSLGPVKTKFSAEHCQVRVGSAAQTWLFPLLAGSETAPVIKILAHAAQVPQERAFWKDRPGGSCTKKSAHFSQVLLDAKEEKVAQ